MSYPAMPLYLLAQKILLPYSLPSRICGLVFILLIAFYINRLNTKFIFIPERTYLPASLYLIICCGLVIHKDFTPLLPGVLLFLFGLERMFLSFRNDNLSYNSFDASLFIGLGSLFYFNFVFLLLFIWASLSVLRPFNWREWIYSFLGLCVPYFILLSIYYLFNLDANQILVVIRDNFLIHNTVALNKVQYIFGGFLTLLILLSIFHLLGNMGNMKILSRRSYNLFIILLLICLGIFFILKISSLEIIYIGAFPISMMFSYYFIMARKSRWLELIFDLFIVSFLLTQFLVLQ